MNRQLAAPLKHFCGNIVGDYKKLKPEIFSCTTPQYLLGWHVKISGSLCILLVIFVEILLIVIFVEILLIVIFVKILLIVILVGILLIVILVGIQLLWA